MPSTGSRNESLTQITKCISYGAYGTPRKERRHTVVKKPSSASVAISTSSRIPATTQLQDEESQQRKSVFTDWWLLEILAAILSLMGLAGIICFLFVIHDKPLESWKVFIQPSTVVSILSALTKSALMLPVVQCLSQLKWMYFSDQARPLNHLNTFSGASTGPVGAAKLLWNVKHNALIASFGAVVTILVLAFDPFAQQVISFKTRQVSLGSENAQLLISQMFDAGTGQRNAALTQTGNTQSVIDAMKGGIMAGLYNVTTPPPITCSAPNCNWSEYTSLAVCNICQNVTQLTVSICTEYTLGQTDEATCDYITPGNLTLHADLSTTPGNLIKTLYNSTSRNPSFFASDMSSSSSLLDFAYLTIPAYGDGPIPQPQVYECSINWCAKTWSSASTKNTLITEGAVTEHPLPLLSKSEKTSLDSEGKTTNTQLYVFSPATNDSSFPSGANRSFTVNAMDSLSLSGFLETTLDSDAAGELIHGSPTKDGGMDILTNIASSLTAVLRTSQPPTLLSPGTSSRSQLVIHITWYWLILPCFVVFSSNLILIVTMITNWRKGTPVWKSSALPLIFHGLEEGEVEGILRARGEDLVSEGMMRDEGTVMKVRLMGHNGGRELRLVRWD